MGSAFKNKRKEIDKQSKKKQTLKDVSMTGLAEAENESSNIPENLMLPRDRFYPDPQVRSKFDQHKIHERAENMRKHGQLSPIKVHPADKDGNHKIINGECRWRATEELEDDFLLWAVVDKDGDNWDEAKRIIVQVSDNVQQIELPDMDTARACHRLTELKLTSEEIAAELGWYMKGEERKPNRRRVGQFLSLIKLPVEGQSLVEDEVVTDLTTLEFLRKIYEANESKFQALVSMIRENKGITRSRAEQEYKSCIANNDDHTSSESSPGDSHSTTVDTEQAAGTQINEEASDPGANSAPSSGSNEQGVTKPQNVPSSNDKAGQQNTTSKQPESSLQPTIRVEWNKSQEGVLVLNKAPDDAGCILVKLDNGDEINAQPHELEIMEVEFA